MTAFRNVLVVVPAFLILHLGAVGFVFPLLENYAAFLDNFGWSQTQAVLLAMAFPLGYALTVPKSIVLASGWSPRVTVVGALVGAIVGDILFIYVADGFWLMFVALIILGGSASVVIPTAMRLLGQTLSLVHASNMAILLGVAWLLSVVATSYFEQGLPLPGAPAWAAPFVVQAFFAVLWLLPALFFVPKSRPTS